MKLTIGDVLVVSRFVTFPNDCGLVATGFQVAVDAVDGYVEFPALKPFDVEVAFAIAPILDLVPLLAPGQELISLLGPEAV